MALKHHALVWLLSAFGLDTSVFCLFLDALGIVSLRWLLKQVQCLSVERSSLFQFTFWGHSVLLAHLFLTCLATCCRCIAELACNWKVKLIIMQFDKNATLCLLEMAWLQCWSKITQTYWNLWHCKIRNAICHFGDICAHWLLFTNHIYLSMDTLEN